MKTFLAALAGLAAALAPLVAAPRYTITNLGSIGSIDVDSTHLRIDRRGMIAGSRFSPEGRQGFRSAGDRLVDLPVLAGDARSEFVTMNGEVMILGKSFPAGTDRGLPGRAFTWSKGAVQPVPIDFSYAALNNSGQVAWHKANSVYDPDSGEEFIVGNVVAYRSDLDGRNRVNLGSLAPKGSGQRRTYAYAMNNRGDVVGTSAVLFGDPAWHPFVFEDGKIKDLAPTFPPYWGPSFLINDRRELVYTKDGRDLFRSRAGTSALKFNASGLNNSGEIVGVLHRVGQSSLPLLYKDGRTYRLADLLPKGSVVPFGLAINNDGEIAAASSKIKPDSDETSIFRLSPVARVMISGTVPQRTRAAILTVRGTAHGPVTRVAVKINGKRRLAEGRARWRIDAPLRAGRNVVEITARTQRGDSLPERVIVQRD